MSGDDDKHAVAEFVERCQNQHDLAFADENAIERAVLVANLASSFMALVFAATYPSRVRALVLVNAYPRLTQAADYP